MSELPADIKKAALAVIGTRSPSMDRGIFRDLNGVILSQAVDAIGQAIMAERIRATASSPSRTEAR